MKKPLEHHIARLPKLLKEFNETAAVIMRHLATKADENGYGPSPRIQIIQQTIGDHYRLPVTIMATPVRTRTFAHVRQVAMVLCREHTAHSLREIGAAFGGRDPQTVIYASAAISDRIQTDQAFANEYATLNALLTDRLKSIDLPLFSRSA